MKKIINEQGSGTEGWGDSWSTGGNTDSGWGDSWSTGGNTDNSWGDSWNNDNKKKKTPSTELPKWASCLKSSGAKKQTDNTVVIKNKKGNTLYFSKSGKFQYTFTSKPGTPNQMGKWSCNGTNGYLITMDNGDKWDGTKWIEKGVSSNIENNKKNKNNTTMEYQPVESGAKTWKGDPYQYKVVNGVWFAKSWKNRGKIIPKWVSLANNGTATGILDGRFPGVRVPKQSTEKSGEYAKGFSDMRKNAENLSKQGIQLPQTDYKKFMTSQTTNTGEGGTQSVTTGDETNKQPEGITQPTTKHNPANADF